MRVVGVIDAAFVGIRLGKQKPRRLMVFPQRLVPVRARTRVGFGARRLRAEELLGNLPVRGVVSENRGKRARAELGDDVPVKVVGAAVRFAERVRHAGGLSVREVVGESRRVPEGVRALENPAQNVLLDDGRVPAPVRRREDDSGVRAGVELPRERGLRSRVVDSGNDEAVGARFLREVRRRRDLRFENADSGGAVFRQARRRVPAHVGRNDFALERRALGNERRDGGDERRSRRVVNGRGNDAEDVPVLERFKSRRGLRDAGVRRRRLFRERDHALRLFAEGVVFVKHGREPVCSRAHE